MLFDELNLSPELNKALKEINYEILTNIQAKTIPELLNKKDVLGIAQTGTGKTAAFALPILQLILNNPKTIAKNTPRAIILAPTKELVIQITTNLKSYSKHTQIKSLALYGGLETPNPHEVEIIIATPEKLDELTNDKIINLKEVEYFVLDEVDKMLDIGSSFHVKKIIKKLPKIKQSMFFSATVSQIVEELVNEILINPIKIEANEEKINTDLIEQFVLFTKKEHKYKLLLTILAKKEVKSSIIFVNSRKEADNLVRFLSNNNITTEALHSQKSNVHRLKVVEHIKTKETKHLVATDLASRGLDIPNLTHTINFELPTSEETYIHRIGRAGRLNNKGVAYSFCSPNERSFLDRIEKLTNNKLKIVTHEFHSEFAKTATGKDSKPQFKRVKKFSKKNKQEQKKNLFPLINQKK